MCFLVKFLHWYCSGLNTDIFWVCKNKKWTKRLFLFVFSPLQPQSGYYTTGSNMVCVNGSIHWTVIFTSSEQVSEHFPASCRHQQSFSEEEAHSTPHQHHGLHRIVRDVSHTLTQQQRRRRLVFAEACVCESGPETVCFPLFLTLLLFLSANLSWSRWTSSDWLLREWEDALCFLKLSLSDGVSQALLSCNSYKKNTLINSLWGGRVYKGD